METAEKLITENLDIWTSAVKAKSSAGRGSSNNQELYGVKKLRELILQLAVMGKLVPQDPEDEPVAQLLKRIAIEKEKLIKEKKIKKQKALPEISESEQPFRIPSSWSFIRLPETYYLLSPGQKKLKSSEINETGKHPVIDQGAKHISGYHDDDSLVTKIPKPVIVFGDHTRNIKLVDHDFIAGADGTKILCPHEIDPKFFHTYLKHFNLEKKGYARHFKVLNGNLIALPPLAEQHRIVAKVDELMGLCDQLEQEQESSLETHDTLVTTLLGALTDANANASAFAEAWQRIQANFDTLFTTESSIDQLKQTILQLAVMGKLVPQDAKDKAALMDPNSERTFKGKKKPKWSGPIEESEKPFNLPHNWEWFRLGDVAVLKHGYAFSSEFFTNEPAPFVLTTPGNFHETGGFRDRESKRKYYEGPVNPEFVFDPGDLIMPMTEQAAGLLGSPAFIPDDGRVYLHNQRLGKISFEPEFIVPEYAFCFFNCAFFRSELARTCTGMKVRHTSPDRVLRVLIPVCPPDEQRRIAEKVDKLMALCDQLKAKFATAQATQLNLADSFVEEAKR